MLLLTGFLTRAFFGSALRCRHWFALICLFVYPWSLWRKYYMLFSSSPLVTIHVAVVCLSRNFCHIWETDQFIIQFLADMMMVFDCVFTDSISWFYGVYVHVCYLRASICAASKYGLWELILFIVVTYYFCILPVFCHRLYCWGFSTAWWAGRH